MLPFIKIGPITIAGYGVCMALGYLIPAFLAIPIVKKRGLDMNELTILIAYGLLGAIVGGKLLYLIIGWKYIDWSWVFSSVSNFKLFIGSGFVFYGGLIGTAICLVIPKFANKIDLWAYLRYVGALMIPLGHAIGRVGCFLGGCCYGMEYDGPLAVVFPEGSAAPAGIPLFPSQLAEAAGLLLIALINIFIISRFCDARFTTTFYLISYGILRFILEFYRGDSARGFAGSFSTSQWIAIVLVTGTIIGTIVIELLRKKGIIKEKPVQVRVIERELKEKAEKEKANKEKEE